MTALSFWGLGGVAGTGAAGGGEGVGAVPPYRVVDWVEGGEGGDTTTVEIYGETHVTALSPSGSPTVFEDPEVFSGDRVDAVSD